ncbi:hybrid sensor histidine kinase/response regulator [Argonema antarcticum]|uniref:hybrid sensor histidine kinase/response regulator n=1 Tax=Argonema antarcticum TaxID=2942763 RepID=UPI0020111AD5|nr:ATP-binding protein [Argonema antarcticum]MCL1472959.1 response regulator [Argonema antarcticum A004/B2]
MTVNIMVVEDEIIIAMDIKERLKKLGYTVPAIVASGEKAIQKAEEIQPDLVLMDIMLKGAMDGVEAADIIWNRLRFPVVFLTANTDIKTIERAKKTQPFGYLVKPFEEKELYTTIEIALARHQAEIEIRKALEKEKELGELKSRFVTMVSHEFRTPMATILFSAGLLEKYQSIWHEEKKMTHIHRIQTAIEHMTDLLNDVLVVGKAEAGKLEFRPAPMDLEGFCHQLLEDIKHADKECHPLELTIQSAVSNACMDENLLRHILTNLLSNAIKYSPQNSPVQFQLLCQDGQAVFQIRDAGIGINPEDEKQLFEMFHRGTNVGNISGTGLGLTIVKKSVDLHQGQIAVESEPGVGTTFTVTLPLNLDSQIS